MRAACSSSGWLRWSTRPPCWGRSRTPWRHGRWRASRPRTCWRATWPARRCCRCWTTSSSAAAAPGPSAAVPRPRRFGRRPAAADPVRRDRLELSRELQRLLADRANLQEAFETVHEQGRDDRIAAAIPQVWRVWRASRLGMRDGVRWAELVLAGRHELPGDVELPMLFAVSELFRFAGDPAQARALKEDAIALARNAPELVRAPQMRTRFAYALASLADLAMDDGRYDEARELLHESLEEGGAHRTLGSLGYLALLEDDLPTAERYVLAALDG